MSEEPKSGDEVREAAAIRRRWVTLGEVLAVVAVLISGLTLWNSYSERSSTEAERQAARREEAEKSQILVLRAEAGGGGKRLTLAAVDPAHAIQSQTIAFPSTLGAPRIDTVIDPRIEAGWIERALRKAPKEGSRSGDRRVPVAITTRFVNAGKSYEETALYDVGYKRDSGLLGGGDVELRGLSRIERAMPAKAQRRLDSLWNARQSGS